MPMTDRDNSDGGLDAYFSAARRTAPAPSSDLLDRIATDAETEANRRAVAPPARGGWLAVLSGLLGGRQAVAGLGAAVCAGLVLGLAPPDTLSALWTGEESDAVAAALVDPASVYDVALLGN